MPKIATIDTDEAVEETRKAAQAGISADREGLQLVRQSTPEIMDAAQREMARQSVQDPAKLGQLFTQLVQEQTRHARQVATAFGRTPTGVRPPRSRVSSSAPRSGE